MRGYSARPQTWRRSRQQCCRSNTIRPARCRRRCADFNPSQSRTPPSNGGHEGMSFDLIIRGGTVVLPETDGIAADIAISNGRIAAIMTPGMAAETGETLDASGKTILPGVIDVHLHLGHGKDIARPRVPEDAATETAAAAIGSVTAFVPYLMATDPFA